MPRRRFLGVVTAAVIGFSSACGDTSDPFITGLVDRTKPDGARVTEYFGARRSSAGVEASWLVETDMPWDRYVQWVTNRLSPGFETAESVPEALTFRKSFDADVYTIRFERIAERSRAGVQVTVQGRPH